MSTPRQKVAERIRADHPAWRVFEWAKQPGNVSPGHPVVAVFRTGVDPNPKSVMVLDHSVTVQAFGARTIGAEAEDEMDNLLDGVMLSIERLNGYVVKSAKRATFYEGSLSGWEIEVTMTSPNVYRDTVMREGNNA